MTRAVVVAMLLALSPKPGSSQTPPDRLPTWLVGCWERRGTLVIEERWLPARGGMLFGVSVSARGDQAVSWEFLRIERNRDRLVYHAVPAGQLPTAFPAIVESDTLLVFENLDHDFPDRIIYRPKAADSLHARIEGTVRDSLRGIDFRFQRVACPSSEATR
ncbi:MAG: hypothetical protein FJ206_09500 [Gemmatimonadetes bacterium]|nr:hypothetical protein [Gemmatimonadota bacterium]